MPRTRRPYPSDLTDQEWDLLEPLLASPEGRGRPPKWPVRRIAEQCSTYTALRLCLANAPARVSSLANRLLPLP